MSGDKTNTTGKQPPSLTCQTESWKMGLLYYISTVTYSPYFYSWPFATECAMDLVESTNWQGSCRTCVGYYRNLQCVTLRFSNTTQVQPPPPVVLTILLLMRKAEATSKKLYCTWKLFHNGWPRKLQGFISRPLLEKQTLVHVEFSLVSFLHFRWAPQVDTCASRRTYARNTKQRQ
jgi:hypothetical protein